MANAEYNISTPVGQVRFHAADTDMPNAVWDDSEITYALSLSQSDPIMAASWLLESAAADAAKLARMAKVGGNTLDERGLADALAARAARLRSLSNAVPAMMATPDRIFSTDTECGRTRGTMSGW